MEHFLERGQIKNNEKAKGRWRVKSSAQELSEEWVIMFKLGSKSCIRQSVQQQQQQQ